MSTPIADPNENFNYERDRPSSQLISSKEPSVENESLFEKLKKVIAFIWSLRSYRVNVVIFVKWMERRQRYSALS